MRNISNHADFGASYPIFSPAEGRRPTIILSKGPLTASHVSAGPAGAESLARALAELALVELTLSLSDNDLGGSRDVLRAVSPRRCWRTQPGGCAGEEAADSAGHTAGRERHRRWAPRLGLVDVDSVGCGLLRQLMNLCLLFNASLGFRWGSNLSACDLDELTLSRLA